MKWLSTLSLFSFEKASNLNCNKIKEIYYFNNVIFLLVTNFIPG